MPLYHGRRFPVCETGSSCSVALLLVAWRELDRRGLGDVPVRRVQEVKESRCWCAGQALALSPARLLTPPEQRTCYWS